MAPLRTRARPALLRHLNERAILTAIQHRGPLSRAELTRHTGISGPTVTRTVSSLMASGLLEEGDAVRAALGRPGKVLRLAATAAVLGGVVGAVRCELVVAALDGRVLPEQAWSFPTPPRYADLVRTFVRQAQRFLDASATPVLGLGLSVPGLLDHREKRTVVSPNVHQTDGRCLGADLGKRLGLETVVLQESQALCLAEQMYGAAQGVKDFAMLDVSEGLGLGVVQGGHLLKGHRGLAGELGHLTVELDGKRCGCGNRGCLETVATDSALLAAVAERLGRKLGMDELIAEAQAARLTVTAELERVLQYLAVGLAAVINVFNPSKLFLYGRCLDAVPEAFARLLELTRQRALAPALADCAIVRAQGSKRLGAVAGIIHRLTTGREEPLE